MFYVGYFFGIVTCSFYLYSAYLVYCRLTLKNSATNPTFLQTVFPTRKTKKTPKAPSELDEWKKEQKKPPADPGSYG